MQRRGCARAERRCVAWTAALGAATLLLGGGCDGCGADEGEQGADDARTVVAYTSVDQVFSEPIFRYCEEQADLEVRGVFDTEETKSTGVLNRLIAEADNPQADVFWSGDPVRPFLLIERELVEPHESSKVAGLPPAFRAADGSWTGFAARARVLLVNREQVSGQEPPRSIEALKDPKWQGKAAIANPLYGTTTMHVAAWFATWGDERAKQFLEALEENDVRIASSNGEVKRLVASGEVAFGLTDTDDAHEALESGAPVDVVYPDQGGTGTLVMPTTVVRIRNGPHPEAARRLIDCLLEPEVERRMAKSAAHMPLRPDVQTPRDVRGVAAIDAMEVDYEQVGEAMERIEPWLRQWVGL